MKKIPKYPNYTEWFNAEEMHEASKEWLSELEFIKDEHLFFDDLVTTFTAQLIAPEKFSKGKEIIDIIYKSQKENNILIDEVKTHESNLKIMIDGVDQIKEEEAYVKEHRRLITSINAFLKDYKTLKIALFTMIKAIKKEDKLKHLIDRK